MKWKICYHISWLWQDHFIGREWEFTSKFSCFLCAATQLQRVSPAEKLEMPTPCQAGAVKYNTMRMDNLSLERCQKEAVEGKDIEPATSGWIRVSLHLLLPGEFLPPSTSCSCQPCSLLPPVCHHKGCVTLPSTFSSLWRSSLLHLKDKAASHAHQRCSQFEHFFAKTVKITRFLE